MYWQTWPTWRRYLPAALTVLVIIAFWILQLTGRTETGLVNLWVGIWVLAPDWVASTVLIFAGGILVVQKGTRYSAIPLATARAERHPAHWTFQWQERGRKRTRRIPSDPATDSLLTGALDQVKAAADAGQPLPSDAWTWPTVLHEGRPPDAGPLLWILLFAAALFLWWIALAVHPLAALPLAAVPYVSRSDLRPVRYALTAEGLWVAWPGPEAALVPADQISEVTGTKRRITIRTRNPWCPVVVMGTNGLRQVTLDWMERTRT